MRLDNQLNGKQNLLNKISQSRFDVIVSKSRECSNIINTQTENQKLILQIKLNERFLLYLKWDVPKTNYMKQKNEGLFVFVFFYL